MGESKKMKFLKRLGAAAVIALSASSWADNGITDTTVTLGMSAPFSGPNGAYGEDMRQTVERYFDQVNKGGGINGRKLQLVALDDGYETERTVANTRTLINDKKVFALLSFYGSSPTTEAMNTVFGPAGVPLVGTISGAATLRQPISANPNSRLMFHVRASYADETEAIVNQMVSIGLRSIAVFYQNDGFGKAGLEGVAAALKKHNLAPSAVGTVERNSLDVNAAVQAIAKSNPQAVVMVTLYKPTAAFVRAMKRAGQNPMFMTLSPVGTEQLVQELGPEARGIGISQVVPYPWNDIVPVVRDYQKLAAKAGSYSYYGLEAYLTARTMVEGLRRAGRDLSRDKLISSLESISNVDFGGYRVNYSPTARHGSRFVELTVIGPGGKVLR
ncbi:amino acid/amide ABC transporter substrate-binding protein (HAAT family) [Azonexus fungiphilus]|jgi:ABC-type branched-subunit amino acid transport system substrate-binding protein|uniref:Amino acid/amide ABC transporter substrate-binding protein (HAAT family) n=2 Tax=Azonexus fungiphilus TaxID=146940 RepID=A0A495WCN9_9RHOO|nr:amino acid/amide ABC transporter substrate-binding protein (HAAT family) [Azonexus fungiphilus]